MGNPFSSKDFKRLQSEWYKKLSESGFSDLESPKDPDAKLQKEARIKNYSLERETYFSLAENFLERSKLTPLESSIWALHAEGLSLRETMHKLKLKYYVCQRVVLRLKKAMLNGE
jgi:hypothetical protein